MAQEPIVFEQRLFFTKSHFCRIYEVTAEKPSGCIPHSHDYMQIWFVENGQCEHFIEGKKHLMCKGDVFIIPPKIEHIVLSTEDSRIICCDFSFEHFFPAEQHSAYSKLHETTLNLSFAWLFLKDADGVRSQFALSPEIGKRVNELMQAMLREYETAGIYFEEFLRVEIMELLLVLAREYSQSPQRSAAAAVFDKYKPMVEAAIRYVDAHYTEPLRLEDVCRVSMVSKTYFCYLFKLLTRQTLVEFITSKRIQRAVELLEDPSNSITWIAFEIGFNDSTHFARTFKKCMGVSPRTYRAMKNGKE